MVSIQQSVAHPAEANQGGKHILFVEGNSQSIDVSILRTLFQDRINVEPLGPSSSVKAVAKALLETHPTYYFLVDRDHQSEQQVEDSWQNFRNPNTLNMIIWRKKEVENYFLDADYLLKSDYKKPRTTKKKIEEKILQLCQQRLYMEVVNFVIVTLRETLKATWIRNFSDPSLFPDEQTALNKLQNMTELSAKNRATSHALSQANIQSLFESTLAKYTGGQTKLCYGHGEWINLLSGNEVLNQIINQFFQVTNQATNVQMQGVDKLNAVVRQLLQLDLTVQPADFQELHGLIYQKVIGT